MAPDKIQLSKVASHIGRTIDVFLCCASYENRCYSIAANLDADQIGISLIGVSKTLREHVSDNADSLDKMLIGKTQRVDIDTTNPLVTADAWNSALQKLPKKKGRCWFCDITTLTHEALLILLRLIHIHSSPTDTVMIGYASAEDYDPKNTGIDKWLSKGVADVRSVLGYPGTVLPSKKNHLIVLVGYEHERATRLIEAFEPSIVSLGYTSLGSDTYQKHRDANRKFLELAKELASRLAAVLEFDFPCNNPWGTRQAIREQIQKHASYNNVIAPMNTKLSTVGCALLAMENEAIQLCYAQPMRYNYAHYSTPGDTCYIFEVNELVNPNSDS